MDATINSEAGVKVLTDMVEDDAVDAARRAEVGLHRGVERLAGRQGRR